MFRSLICSVIVVSGIAASVASAADVVVSTPYYGQNRHSSTHAEGFQRGMADVIRSSGEANLRNSEAAINMEAARSANMDNHLKYTETYFEMRKMNTAYRQQEAGERITQQAAERIARERAPSRIAAENLDPVTGGIEWPAILLDGRYDEFTKPLNDLFSQRAETGGSIGSGGYGDIRAACDGLMAALRENIREYPSNQYLEARKFVEQLSFEARFAAG